MPHTIQGFGTTYYGKRDFSADGSYLTTEWIVFAMVPFFPRCSLRVREGKYTSDSPFHSTQEYVVLEEQEPNIRQVASVYAFTALFLGWVVFAFWLFAIKSNLKTSWPWLISVPLPFAVPLWLRRRSRERACPDAVFRLEQVLIWWRYTSWKEKLPVVLPITGILIGLLLPHSC